MANSVTKKVGTPGPVRLSYAFIAHPRPKNEQGAEKYGALLMIPKSDKDTIKALSDAVKEVFNNNPGFFKGYSLKAIMPILDGAEETKSGKQRDELFKDYYVLNVSSNNRPKCIDKDSNEILDVEEAIYSGCWAKVGLTIAPYSVPNGGKVGIGCYLNLVKKMLDDTRLAGNVDEKDYWATEEKKADANNDPLS